MDTTLLFLLKQFLHDFNYQINSEEIELQLLSHPSYPSIHSATGVLNHFGIDNLALEVPNDMDTLKELPECFLSTTNEHKYILIKKINDSIQILFGDGAKKDISINEFLVQWSGFIVVIEKNAIKGKNKENKFSQTRLLYYSLGIGVISIFLSNGINLFNSTHFALSLTGLVISGFIIKHEFGYKSMVIEKLCGSKEFTSCDAVLNSDAASLYGNIKLSDACIVYFGSVSLYWILSQLNSITQSVVLVPTLLAMPITLYSLYYQHQIVKKWCPLCLGIIGVLWLHFFSLLTITEFPSFNFEIKDGLVFTSSSLVVVGLWSFIRPLLNDSLELGKLQISHYKFLRNFELFVGAMEKGAIVDTQVSSIVNNEITLGNKNASLKLLLVTNPQCYYCKEAHTDLEKILDGYSQDIFVTIRFSVDTNRSNLALKVSQRLLELYNFPKNELFNNALHEAYLENADLEKWIYKWGEAKSKSQIETLNTQRDWCIENGVNFTPALFINGRAFPREYKREHLSFFVEDLIDFFHIRAEQIEQP